MNYFKKPVKLDLNQICLLLCIDLFDEGKDLAEIATHDAAV